MFDPNKAVNNLVMELKNFFKFRGFSDAVIGLSGGVDSSVTCALAVKALGKEHVTGIIMPELGVSSKESVNDAQQVAGQLGIKVLYQPINDILKSYQLPFCLNKIAQMNLKARVRANILYAYANTHDALVLGTGNKTEILMGYATKYGDAACDVLPIGSLYKIQVWEIARLLGIPLQIIRKKPSAELYQGQFDEDELGYSYQELDHFLIEGPVPLEIANRIDRNKHKSESVPILKFD
ncbi:NAD+ synthase [Candidatus Woesearchaeota archaeon]|nr:NAD+ synthase [Candidatus Woesearchaeota archaeon]